jgi:hypothetical protein
MRCVCAEGVELRPPQGIGKQAYARAHLRELAVDAEAWETLWECPDTGLLWREWYPYPEMQAGGPSAFSPISRDEAKRRFRIP